MSRHPQRGVARLSFALGGRVFSEASRQRVASVMPDRLHRWVVERPHSVVVASFPKSGRTWLRLMLGAALAEHFGIETADPTAVERLYRADARVPGIMFTHDGDPEHQSVTSLEQTKRRYRNKRIILVTRDPRDVLVSLYFQQVNRDHSFEGSMEQWLTARPMLPVVVEYLNIWAANRHVPQAFTRIRYEDLHRDPAGQLERVLDFIGITGVSRTTIADAVARSSFDAMRQLETRGQVNQARLRPGEPANLESFKTRRGKVHGFVDYLDAADVRALDCELEKLDPYFGYTPGRPTSGEIEADQASQSD